MLPHRAVGAVRDDGACDQGQPDDELAAVSCVAYPDLPAVRFDDPARDAEAEPRALPGCRGARGLAAEPDVEHPGQVLGRDPAAGVRYADRRNAGILVRAHLDGAVRRSVPDRVDDQVEQCAPYGGGVHPYRQAGNGRAPQRDTFCPGQRLGAGEHVADQVTEPDNLPG